MEMKIVIDGSKILDEKSFHEFLAKNLEFPYWYGKNLDALWDLITDGYGNLEIEWVNAEVSKNTLGRYKEIVNFFKDLQNYYNNTKDSKNSFTFRINEK